MNFYCRSYKEDGFKPHYDVMYSQMYMGLRFRERKDKVKIFTRLNLGHEIRVGKYFLDDFAMGDN